MPARTDNQDSYYNNQQGYNTPGSPVATAQSPTYSDQDRYNAIKGYYQKYLGRDDGQQEQGIQGWYNGGQDLGAIEKSISSSPEARAFGDKPKTTATKSDPNDPNGVLSGIYAKYGLDPNNPGHGLASIDYFINRMNQTGGWQGANQNYWQDRLSQEIEKSMYGTVGNLIDTGPQQNSTSTNVPGFGAQYGEQNQKLIDLLTSRAKQSLAIDPNTDSVIKPQVDNFAATQERGRRNYLNDLAESSSPYATGAQQTAATQTSEAAGQATAGLQSQLTQNELTSRRTEIQNSLSELGSMLTSDQQLSLQEELGKIDAALKQQQINSGNDQFMANLGLQLTGNANYWDALRSGLITR